MECVASTKGKDEDLVQETQLQKQLKKKIVRKIVSGMIYDTKQGQKVLETKFCRINK